MRMHWVAPRTCADLSMSPGNLSQKRARTFLHRTSGTIAIMEEILKKKNQIYPDVKNLSALPDKVIVVDQLYVKPNKRTSNVRLSFKEGMEENLKDEIESVPGTSNKIQSFHIAVNQDELLQDRETTRVRLRYLFERLAGRMACTSNENVLPEIVEVPEESPQENNERSIFDVRFPKIRRLNNYFHLWDFDKCYTVLDPHGNFYFVWLFIMSLCYIYNLIAIPLRSSFPYQTSTNTKIWFFFDAFCDVFYFLDMIMIKPRVSYLEDGSWMRDPKMTRKQYLHSFMFKMDLISILPVELLYFQFGVTATYLRFPRFFKVQTFTQFYTSIDKMLSSPLIIRVARTLINTFYLIHLNACAYYRVSDFEGIGSNGWVYNGEGNAYLRCFYFAMKTCTSIGKNPKPENEMEYLYMTFAWLMGVCVFALLVGQIRYFMITASKAETEYRNLLAETFTCMRQLNIPCELQKKVTSWFQFTWKKQRTLDDNKALEDLPLNLRTEVAITMHISTLSKVRLFSECDEALLRDLVLRLRSNIFLPGDMICRKGDVGREMYIVNRGEVEVSGGFNNNEVVAVLSEGSAFGEISLLNIDGINRRNADVRSRMFSNIFILNREDFNAVIQHYPDAHKMLIQRARRMMNMNNSDATEEAEPSNNDIVKITFVMPNHEEIESEMKASFEGRVTPIEPILEEDEEEAASQGSSNYVDASEQEELEKIAEDSASKQYNEKMSRRSMPKSYRRKAAIRSGFVGLYQSSSDPSLYPEPSVRENK